MDESIESKINSYLHINKSTFDERGCLPQVLPNFLAIQKVSPYTISWPNFKETFTFNPHRSGMATNLEKFLETLTDNGIEIKRLYIGGSYVSLKPEPQDIDILVCWKPNQKVTNNKQLSEFIDKRATIFDQSLIESKFQIQAHFQCLLGATDTTIHMVGKWIFINSYHRESGIHRGIVCFENLDVTKLIKGENYV